jgi:hypothetical protein
VRSRSKKSSHKSSTGTMLEALKIVATLVDVLLKVWLAT